MPPPKDYHRVVMEEAMREQADRLFEILRSDDAVLALDALGMTVLRVLMSGEPANGLTRHQVFDKWCQHLQRCFASLDG